MSLAPAERRALDTIEDALRRTDRRLARMLTRFRLPLARGGLVIILRRPRRLRRLIVSAVAVAAVAWFVVAVIRCPATTLCSAPARTEPAAAAALAGDCLMLVHEGLDDGTAGAGTAAVAGFKSDP